jgi:hypothetical protein
MKTYYRVTTSLEHEMAGAGLGYEEMYGSQPRYYWDREDAQKRAHAFNTDGNYDPDLAGTYFVEERCVYDDGLWDDSDDQYAREQLGFCQRWIIH